MGQRGAYAADTIGPSANEKKSEREPDRVAAGKSTLSGT